MKVKKKNGAPIETEEKIPDIEEAFDPIDDVDDDYSPDIEDEW